MNKINKLRIKRSISSILAAAMSFSLFTTVPVSAEIGKTTYNYDGYSVEYNVTNEWKVIRQLRLLFPIQVMNPYSTGH